MIMIILTETDPPDHFCEIHLTTQEQQFDLKKCFNLE